MFRALIRLIFTLIVLAGAFFLYQIYRAGHFPFVQQAVADAAMLGSVKTALALNGDLSKMELDVDARDGLVTLEGIVASDEQRELASDLAGSVEGVRLVDNRIEVDPEVTPGASKDGRTLGQALDDVTLLAKIHTALRLDRETKDASLDVSVTDGIVVLHGRVRDAQEAERIRTRIRTVGGVQGLEDYLELSDAAQ